VVKVLTLRVKGLERLAGTWTYQCLLRYSSSDKSPSQGTKKDKDKITRAKTPIGKLDELEEGQHPYQEKEPLPPWPNNTNPHTGEIGGPRGPEPTRYGDWERKGRVSDF